MILFLRNVRTFLRKNFHFSRNLKSDNLIQEQWEEKMKYWMKKYEDMFGITKLSEMHERVLKVQTQVQNVQEKRRNVQEEIFIVQKKLQEMQDILHKTSMGDNLYISVVTQVHELLKQQKQLQDVFSLYDQTEREQQATLAISINNSQDHEKTYREKNKYLSLITGVVGALLGLLGSSFSNWRHRRDIKLFANDISNQVVELQKNIDKLNLNYATKEAKSGSEESSNMTEQFELHKKLLEDNVNALRVFVNEKIGYENGMNEQLFSDESNSKVISQFEGIIDSKLNRHTYLNIGVISSVLMMSALILYFNSSN